MSPPRGTGFQKPPLLIENRMTVPAGPVSADVNVRQRRNGRSVGTVNKPETTDPCAARWRVSKVMPRRTGVTLELAVIKTARTWTYSAPGIVKGCGPEPVQLTHELQAEPLGFESFPLRRDSWAEAGAGASSDQLTRRKSDAVPSDTGADRYVPLCRLGKKRETSSMRMSTDDALVLLA